MSGSAHILIVDDEPAIRMVLAQALRSAQYRIETASNSTEAIRKLQLKAYDLILLDLYMDGLDGLEVLKTARQHDPDVIVIILTAHGSLDSAVEALRLGAFDYLFKPILPETLRERVAEGLAHRQQALQKRILFKHIAALKESLESLDVETIASQGGIDSRFLKAGPLIIDQHHRSAVLDGRPLELTTTEYDVLVCLVKAAPHPLAAQELVHCALGYEASALEAQEIIKWHIHRLRRKIEANPRRPIYLKTVRRRGYMWAGG